MTSSELPDLIKSAQGHGAKARKAVDRLVEIGMSAVPAVIDALRKARVIEVGLLPLVLLRIRDPKLVALLMDELDSENVELAGAAFTVLGKSNDPAACNALASFAEDESHGDVRRAMAVEALGNFDSERIRNLLPELLRRAASKFDKGDEDAYPVLLVTVVTTLAALGDHSGGPALLEVVDSSSMSARSLAVEALRYVVAPDMMRALTKALHDEDEEVQVAAVDPLFLLGSPRAVDALASALDSTYDRLNGNVRARLADITDRILEEGETSQKFIEWWGPRRASYSATVVYRLGKALDIVFSSNCCGSGDAAGRWLRNCGSSRVLTLAGIRSRHKQSSGRYTVAQRSGTAGTGANSRLGSSTSTATSKASPIFCNSRAPDEQVASRAGSASDIAAQARAEAMGFSSLQEAARIFLYRLAKGHVDIQLEEKDLKFAKKDKRVKI